MRAELARHIAAPFEWDESDCGFAFSVVRAITGFDAIAGLRGYEDGPEALRRLRAAGYPSVLDLVAAHFPEIPPSEAMRGDLGYPATVEPLMSPAVINGPVAHSKSLAGPVVVPRGLIVRAFAV